MNSPFCFFKLHLLIVQISDETAQRISFYCLPPWKVLITHFIMCTPCYIHKVVEYYIYFVFSVCQSII